MRVFVLGALALVGAAPPGPAFEYKGFRAGEIITSERLAPCKVKADEQRTLLAPVYKSIGREPESPDLLTCSAADVALAGTTVQSEEISFYKSRLTRVSIMTNSASFQVLQRAFETKYGPPCQMGVKNLQTIGGASLQSPYYTWCFATGKLTAVMMGPSIDMMSASYEDDWRMPEKRPKIDF